MCITYLAQTIAKCYFNQLQTDITDIANKGHKLTLVALLANTDPCAQTYANWTHKACEQVGIHFDLRVVERIDLEDQIQLANIDKTIHGIMVYYPVFNSAQDQYLQNCISPIKDVEGLCHTFRYNMYHNIRFLDPPANTTKSVLPCTPLAIVKVLEHINVYNTLLPFGDRLFGKTIAVINRSEVVGRPLAALLANDGAMVYSIDIADVQVFHRGHDLKHKQHIIEETSLTANDVLGQVDVVITGVPSTTYKVLTSILKPGVVCINFSSNNNFEMDTVKEKAAMYVPSIGKVTIAMLQRNLIRLFHYQLSQST